MYICYKHCQELHCMITEKFIKLIIRKETCSLSVKILKKWFAGHVILDISVPDNLEALFKLALVIRKLYNIKWWIIKIKRKSSCYTQHYTHIDDYSFLELANRQQLKDKLSEHLQVSKMIYHTGRVKQGQGAQVMTSWWSWEGR